MMNIKERSVCCERDYGAMMTTTSLAKFLTEFHKGVLSTRRKDGGSQLSIVTVGLIDGEICFSITERRSKFYNLMRDPTCSLLVSQDDWWGYIVVEGKANLKGSFNTHPETLRKLHRVVYRETAGKDHPDWEEFDQAMISDQRVAVIIEPEKIYGTALN